MSNSDRKRYAMAAMAVKELHPKMLRKLVSVHISAQSLQRMIANNTHGIHSILHRPELSLVQTLLNHGYDKLDESLLYKIISCFNLVQRPSKGWGNSPTDLHQTTLGDDIERLRKKRNALVHSPEPHMSEIQLEEFFDELYEIARRFDIYLHQYMCENCFQNKVISMKKQSPDPETQAKYIEALENVLEKNSKYY